MGTQQLTFLVSSLQAIHKYVKLCTVGEQKKQNKNNHQFRGLAKVALTITNHNELTQLYWKKPTLIHST